MGFLERFKQSPLTLTLTPSTETLMPGDSVEVEFDYAFGGPLNSLRPTARLV